MYFFSSFILIILITISSLTVLKYFIKIKKFNDYQNIIIFLIFFESIILLFGNNRIIYLFLDFVPFLAYLLNRRKEGYILLIFSIIYASTIYNFPVIYYIGYLIIISLFYIIKNNDQKMLYIVSIKAFFTSFIYFLDNEYNTIIILSFILIYISFYILLEITEKVIKRSFLDNDNKIIFQVAHEVKNPIAVCKGYLDMIEIDNKINDYLPIVKSEMNRALSIMDDFLDLKRLSLSKECMDLTLLLDDVKSTMSMVLDNKNIILDIPRIDDEILLDGDYDKLKQVLINLIKNSYEANAKKIIININENNNKVEVKVIDDGCGISASDLDKVGNVFYTTKVKGTGLGVSMCKEIMKLHNGSLNYQSIPNKGTIATLILPCKYVF